MRYLSVCVAAAAMTFLLAACHSSQPSPNLPAGTPAPAGQQEQQVGGDAVTGHVLWPDGHPAANTQVYWYLGGYSLDSSEPNASTSIPVDGSYALDGCPCSPLVGYLVVPATDGAGPLDGGRDCWIILQADGTYSGITASPGSVIDWQAVDMPCSAGPFRSDPYTVQLTMQTGESELANPGGDQTATAGTWQAAEARTSGS